MSVVTYKCPNCDGGLIFDPDSQKFICEYCQSSFTEEEIKRLHPASQSETIHPAAAAQPQNSGTDEAAETDGAMLYTCPSCGAEVAADSTTAATYCFYCHNPVVLSGRLDGSYTPHKIIPFRISKEEAQERFLAWVKKKWFVPKYFFSKKQLDQLSGVYFPHWLVDCDLQGDLTATAKKIRVWRSGDTEYTETEHYQLYRAANIHFEDVVKSALKKADRKLVESVQPYDSSQIIDFSMAYLSGFQAEKRDIERNELQQEVTNEVHSYAGSLLRDAMQGYSGITPIGGNMRMLQEHWDYTLLPVWTLTYQGKDGKLYYYAMNGQTGTVFGKLPIAYGKLALTAGIVAAILLILLLIGGWLF